MEEKYVGVISSRLSGFKRPSMAEKVWNFQCPLCKETKKKAYFYPSKTTLRFKCFKCGENLAFRKLLEMLDDEVYKDYVMELFKERQVPMPAIPFTSKVGNLDQFFKPHKYVEGLNTPLLQKVSSLPASHYCKQYIVSRMIPNKFHARLFFAEKFKAYTNSLVPGKFDEKSLRFEEPRLIIPLLNEEGKMFGFQGRSFKPDSPTKYITIYLIKNHVCVYGLDGLKPSDRIYVVEGPFDSMFIPNALAMLGAGFDPTLKAYGVVPSQTTIVYDNERRNKKIIELIEDAIKDEYSVCLWPDEVKQKDINEMVCAGRSGTDIQKIIDTSTYKGMTASLKLAGWKRV